MNDVKPHYQWFTVFVVSFASYLVFHRYEPQSVLNVSCLIFLLPATATWLILPSPLTLAAINIFASYWFLLLTFTVVYRLSPFHPLSKIPGPLIYKITKLRVAYSIAKGNRHIIHHQLHLKYGDMVRIGPNEVSYCNIDAIELTLGIYGLPKGPFYCAITKDPGLFYIKGLADYGQRRKTWNAGFSSRSLKRYEENIIRRSRDLVDSLRKRTSAVVDMSKWMEYFIFDVMGDMVFNYPFDLVKSGEDVHEYRKIIIESMQSLISFLAIPWFVKLTSGFFNAWGELRKVAGAIANERLKDSSDDGDLFYHFAKEEKGKQKMAFDTLIMECYTAIVAGADTTSTVLTSLWYYLLQNPSCYHRLREELDETFPAGEDPVDQQRLSEMPFLSACINEAMRLLPPVPSGSQRVVPYEIGGIHVGGHFLPGGTCISIPPYSLQRHPRYFYPCDASFWPDRWLDPKDRKMFGDSTTKPFVDHDQFVRNTAAFIPFSSGPRICPGKNIAMIEMRIVAACIMRNFDLKAVEGCDFNEWEKNLEDVFILKKYPLPVVLVERG